MKKALEAYWRGELDESALKQARREVENQGLLAQGGIDRVGIGDVTFYDHVLDWALRFGLIPARFRHLDGLELTFAMARGSEGVQPLELTKWFDTNYHYLVPEIEEDIEPEPRFDDFLEMTKRSVEQLGERAAPIVLGPMTLLTLSRLGGDWRAVLGKLMPLYRELLQELNAIGVSEVQIHEPALVLSEAAAWETSYRKAFDTLAEAGPALNLVTYFDDLGETYPWVVDLPISTLSLDFTRGNNLDLMREHGWPSGLTLGAGVVDGRSVWRIRPGSVLPLIKELRALAPLRVGASSSMMFLPYAAVREGRLPDRLHGALAFADEKLDDLRLLASVAAGNEHTEELDALDAIWASLEDDGRRGEDWQERLSALGPGSFERRSTYDQRRKAQVGLPPFPTTTIGSFPQTPAIRSLRARHRRGEVGLDDYRAEIDGWIEHAISKQEDLGLDVLVHGEFERTDMVEFFAEKLEGIAVTQHGWVQSYGNRYVRPPIIWSDIRREEPMTLREFNVAKSHTDKPVKGMITGPVTILNWSFPRIDIPRKEIALQIALALREEVVDLETAGARVIQVDEPALREGMPLKPERWQEYLTWAVDAFRLATAGVHDETQVHTHMCYAEFGEILEAIERMDADVISIENARSNDEGLVQLAEGGYQREIGPGVYDVHSVKAPKVKEMRNRLEGYLQHLSPEQIWVNPDCGLKTRTWEDTLPALTNMISAVQELRMARGADQSELQRETVKKRSA
jgi:5-methyltetrahydropteroyltriglutamate--homocysteine methyltransferase